MFIQELVGENNNCKFFITLFIARVEIALSFLISSWVLVGPGLEFPHLEKTVRGPVRSGSSEEFLVSLKYGKSICIWRGPD